MPVDLNRPPTDVDINSPRLPNHARQPPGQHSFRHGRDFARHVFVQFAAAPERVREWLTKSVGPNVTTAKDQYEQIAKRRSDELTDGGLVTGFFLSAKGYQLLGFDIRQFASGAFRKGMKHRDDDILEVLLDTTNKDPLPG